MGAVYVGDFGSDEEGWRDMDQPVGRAMRLTGPAGSMEFSEDGTKWRSLYPDGTPLVGDL